MNRLTASIEQFLKIGTLISTYGLILSVLVQIFARFFLENPPAWTEEASRLCFIYAVAFAGGLALKDGEYVALDLVYRKLSRRGQQILDLGIPLLIMVLFGTMAAFALPLMGMSAAETSPGMGLNMSIAFGSMFLLAVSLVYFGGGEVRKALKKWNS